MVRVVGYRPAIGPQLNRLAVDSAPLECFRWRFLRFGGYAVSELMRRVPPFVWSALVVAAYAGLRYLLVELQGSPEWWAPVAVAAIMAALKVLEMRREGSGGDGDDAVHVMAGRRRSALARFLLE